MKGKVVFGLNKLSLPQKSDNRQALEGMVDELSRRMAAARQETCPVNFTKAAVEMCLAQSCGKCVPCRIGLQNAADILNKILDGCGTPEDLALLKKTAAAAAESADCVIGSRAGGLILEGLAAFRSDFESHIQRNRCAARTEQSVPCVSLCPAHVDIPGYIALVHAGRYADAVRLIRKDNPFPSVCGFVCEHPCEAGCRRNMPDDAINIRGLKRYAADHAGDVPAEKAAAPTGKKVAVIGAGPSGLTAAYYLALMGHEVDVYERHKTAGGMLLYGIPGYRLPRDMLRREIENILAVGNIRLHLDTDIGKDITVEELRRNADAVYVAIGAQSDLTLGVEGEQLHNVTSAVSFLRGIGEGNIPDFKGKKVAVIGGGNVAMDSARSAVRLGAEKVSIVYRRRQADMTALEEEIIGAIADGCHLVTMMAPARMEGDENGNVKALYVKPQISGAIDKSGRPSVSNADAPEVRMEADVVILAIGQSIESQQFGACGIDLKRGRLVTDAYGACREKDGIFAGGDCTTGPATVIMAIAAGKTAARSIDGYLGYDHPISVDVAIPEASPADRPRCGRVNMRERDAADRCHDFNLMEIGMSAEEAKQESGRCLRCDRFGYGAFRGGRCNKW